MKKMKSTLPNMVLSLGVITLVAGALLGLMNMLTVNEIARQSKQSQIDAMNKVLPSFDNDPVADVKTIKTDAGERILYPAYKNGEFVGAAVETSSENGFAGKINLMVGFNSDGTVRDYDVLQHGETPGLGSKMQLWFRDEIGNRSILGKSPEKTAFYVTKDTEKHGEIDAITAATISSRAFLESVRSAFQAFDSYRKEVKK